MNKLLIFAALILLTACQSKETYLADFARFVEDVKAEGDNYSLEQWQNAEKSFQQFAEVDYQKHLLELTKAEREQVGRLKAALASVVSALPSSSVISYGVSTTSKTLKSISRYQTNLPVEPVEYKMAPA